MARSRQASRSDLSAHVSIFPTADCGTDVLQTAAGLAKLRYANGLLFFPLSLRLLASYWPFSVLIVQWKLPELQSDVHALAYMMESASDFALYQSFSSLRFP